VVVLHRIVFRDQGCCLRGGQLLQTRSSNIEEVINELMSMLLVHPETSEGKRIVAVVKLDELFTSNGGEGGRVWQK